MKYIISYTKPHTHYIDIEFIADGINRTETIIQLPAWRPGRYELGNFAKNIQKFSALDENGNSIAFQKITKDSWKIQTKNVSKLHIHYNYYAAELNAGSTYLDASQLYINPVNCCVYIPERIDESCELALQLPEDYNVGIGLLPSTFCKEISGKRCFHANDFHELADSPFIASASLQHSKFICKGIAFNFWFQGECKPDWEKLTTDFTKFCTHQLEMMHQAPFKSYHFIFQILPTKIYHGVEHTTSTVIALGPGYNLMKGDLYEDLLGVSCHELFHAWNVKTIRPAEMQPYNYTKENYSKLGYVCEGVTTYYGDYLLFRSGVFNENQYLQTFAERLQKHFDNFGRSNLSVADSSFDTWLDGYNPGIPNRKTSIYDEGCLLAFITDIFIRKNSGNGFSLDDVMRFLFTEFALRGKGYTDLDYKGVVEHFANSSFDTIFNNCINGTSDYEPLLKEAMDYIGCELRISPSTKFHEHGLGFKISESGGVSKISAVYPGSVADIAWLSTNDELVAINNIQIKPDGLGSNFSEWCAYFQNEKLEFTIVSNGKLKQVELKPKPYEYYKAVQMQKQSSANEIKKINFEKWCANKF